MTAAGPDHIDGEEMTRPITHVLMVTDKSGSMHDLADDVRGGFNSYVEDLRKDSEKKYRLTVTLFNTSCVSLVKAAKPADVPKLDEKNYRTGGMTALLDAIGQTITGFDATTLGTDDRVLVVVQTDGQENSSREHSREQIAALIKEREATGKWSFVFLGAGPETWEQARHMGFKRGSTVSMGATGQAVAGTYSGLSSATRSYSRGGSADDAAEAVAAAAGGFVPDDDQDEAPPSPSK